MIRETSERSRSYNKAEIAIHNIKEFIHLEFEGISTKDNLLTCLMDRGLIDIPIDEYIKNDLFFEDLRTSEIYYKIKMQIAKNLNIPWFFVVYNYIEKKCVVYDLLNNQYFLFSTFSEFGNWFSANFTDNSGVFSRYEESGLPQFDVELRRNGTPWPGNIDDVLIDKKTNTIYCVAEYQNTSKSSIRQHDNNDFLKPSIYRKGDNKRWMVQYVFAKGLETDNVVFVWSRTEDEIAVKKINSFSLDSNGLVSRINWGKIAYIKVNDLSYETIKSVVE
jgi:hypothetical protein